MRIEVNKPERTCSEVEPLLWDYAAGRATEQDALQVSRHLESCEQCRIAAKDYSLTVGALHDTESVPDSRVTWSMVQSKLTTGKLATGFRFKWQPVFAAGLVALIVLVYMRGGIGRQVSPGQAPLVAAKGTEGPVKPKTTIQISPNRELVKYSPLMNINKPSPQIAERHTPRRHGIQSEQSRIAKSDSGSNMPGKRLHNAASQMHVDGGTRWTPAAADYVLPDSTVSTSAIEATYVSGESLGNSTTEAQGW